MRRYRWAACQQGEPYGVLDLACTAVAVLPDGRVVSGSDDETLRVGDIESGRTLATPYGDATFWSLAVVNPHLRRVGTRT
jgi:hypothetical protein